MKLIPPLEYITANGSAEHKVAEVLDAIDDTDAVAYHSVHLPTHRTQIMGEADFVVLWKGVVTVLEVKGGRLSRESGVWFSTDRHGTAHRLSKNPWDQAREARFALQDVLSKKVLGSKRPYAHAVVTPDQDLPADPERGSWEYMGAARMSPVGMARSLDVLSRKAREVPGTGDHARGPTLRPVESLNIFKSVLRQDVDRIRTTSEHEHRIDKELVSLFAGQATILEQIEDNPRLLIHGGAGTGKTLIALEAARREAAAGANVVFTCRSEGVLRFAASMLEETTVRIVSSAALPESPAGDVLVVDEAQDLMNSEDMLRLDESVSGSLSGGRWWLFLDGNNQAQLSGLFDAAILGEITALGAKVSLRNNIRNARSVVTAVQTYLGADLGTPRVGEGPRVDITHEDSAEGARQAIDKRLSQLELDGVGRKSISIVSAASPPGSSCLAVDGVLPEHYTGNHKKYEVTTAAAVKGLERDHVLVVDVDDLDGTAPRNATYVAFTRPKYSLWACTSNKAYAAMKQIAAEQLAKGDTNR